MLAVAGAVLGLFLGYFLMQARFILSGGGFVSRHYHTLAGTWAWLLETVMAAGSAALLAARGGWLLGSRRAPSRLDGLLLVPLITLALLVWVSNAG